jgi:hypothetical protein
MRQRPNKRLKLAARVNQGMTTFSQRAAAQAHSVGRAKMSQLVGNRLLLIRDRDLTPNQCDKLF